MSPVAVKVPVRGGAQAGEGRERWSLGGEGEGGDWNSSMEPGICRGPRWS